MQRVLSLCIIIQRICNDDDDDDNENNTHNHTCE